MRYRLVLYTCTFYFFLDFLPHFGNYVIFKLLNISFADYSPFSQFCSAIDTAICSEIYWRTFKAVENSEVVT
uniref:Uncharacterized protein n=1 Tax=Panagrolaimus sp. JU765 TaxID=591449 RepID=A0AC34QRY7_9BILA